MVLSLFVVLRRFFEVGGDSIRERLRREDSGVAGVLHRPVAHGFQIHGHAGGGFVAGASVILTSLPNHLIVGNTLPLNLFGT